VNDFEPAVTESAQSISVTAVLLAVMTGENDSVEILTLDSLSNCVTTVCEHAKESRPVFPGHGVLPNQSFEGSLRRHGTGRTGS
jgi:hypothetical protein